MPPLEIGFERFEENELDSETIPEKQQKCSTVDTMSVWMKQYHNLVFFYITFTLLGVDIQYITYCNVI